MRLKKKLWRGMLSAVLSVAMIATMFAANVLAAETYNAVALTNAEAVEYEDTLYTAVGGGYESVSVSSEVKTVYTDANGNTYDTANTSWTGTNGVTYDIIGGYAVDIHTFTRASKTTLGVTKYWYVCDDDSSVTSSKANGMSDTLVTTGLRSAFVSWVATYYGSAYTADQKNTSGDGNENYVAAAYLPVTATTSVVYTYTFASGSVTSEGDENTADITLYTREVTHEHTAGDSVVENEVAATCTTDGSYDTVVYCSDCGEEMSRVTTIVAATGHVEGDPVVENEIEVTCTTDGSYDTVVYCTVCGDELSRVATTVTATGHTAGKAVVENKVEATCTKDGSYDTVVYCTVCGAELSRDTTTVEATGHTEGEAVVENEVEATCTKDGSYDSVIYCTECGEELSRETITVSATGHTAGEAVTENEVAATCTKDGSYDTVVYCTVCGAELSRETTTVEATGHTEDEAVVENKVEATCTKDGSYDTVVYCEVCGAELSRETTTVAATGHVEGEPVVENKVEATCTNDGSYDTVVYCTVCEEELSRDTTTVEATGHVDGEPVVENEVEATCTKDGSYDTVVYCTVCGAELSRDTTTVEATGHTWDDGVVTVEPTETETGVKTYTCTVCEETYTEVIPVTHTHVYTSEVTKEATCTEEGITTYTCSCGDTYTETIAKLECKAYELGATDIDHTAWYHEAVNYALTEGFMTVYSDDTFGVNTTVTRAMLAEMLYKKEGSSSVTVDSNPFTDVSSDAWYYNSVMWANVNGIVTGYTGTTEFRPTNAVTRQEAAIMIVRYLIYKGELTSEDLENVDTSVLNSYSDASSISSWAENYVALAVSKGIINGYDDANELRPLNNITRAEMAQILYNIFE